MPQDIRSFFSVISSNKPTSKNPPPPKPAKKRAILSDSSDDDFETKSSKKKAKIKTTSKPPKQILSSDSEDDSKPKTIPVKSTNGNKKPDLKPVNAADFLGTQPVKQTKVVTVPQAVEIPVVKRSKSKSKSKKVATEIGIHDDKAFEESLLQLDEEMFLDSNLDKTIEEALNSSQSQGSPKKDKERSTEKASLQEEKIPQKASLQKEKGPPKASFHNEETPEKPQKKRKISETEDVGDPDELRYERKRQSAALYQKYLHRGGPAHHGSKELPKGKPDCLQNKCFLRTGVLDSLDGDDFESLIKEHGGRVVHGVSRKVNYLVVGVDPGPAKLAKAESYGIPQISEDELLDMIRVKSGLAATQQAKKETAVDLDKFKHEEKASSSKLKKNSTKTLEEDIIPKETVVTPKTNKTSIPKASSSKATVTLPPLPKVTKKVDVNSLPWTEKYKPVNIKSIIGQQGDRSNMRKLLNWLNKWYVSHSKDSGKKPKPNFWNNKNDDGSSFKAALLSGPPGVGKTTTATLVAKELGFDVVEFNASDTRSKRLLHEEVSQLLNTKSLACYMRDGSAPSSRHVLLMDEVDGMAGNEDRGGMQELILLIKKSNIPVICMCNDRNHPKVRSLANYCFDLRFSKPRADQISDFVAQICRQENIQIGPAAVTEIINAASQDIRQVLNHLSMLSIGTQNLSVETAKGATVHKDVPIGPFEVVRKVFSKEEHKNMSMGDRARLFFHDYSIGPLFVQENYLQVVPACHKKQLLQRVANSADAISMGDLVDTKIRRTNNWSLLEVEAMCASALPGYYMEGHMGGQINFPSWLGKTSKKNKFQRLLTELYSHMLLSISGSRSALNMDYVTPLRNAIVRPLAREGAEGVEKSLEVMHHYNLLREDLDSLIELAGWPHCKDPWNSVDSKIKSQFTRIYNKHNNKLPYAVQSGRVIKKAAASANDYFIEGEEDAAAEESEKEDDKNIEDDGMIKVKKQTARASKAAADPTTSKRGKGGGARGGSRKK